MLEISWTNPSNSDSSQIYAETPSCEARKLSPPKNVVTFDKFMLVVFQKKTNLLTFMLIKYITYNFFLSLNLKWFALVQWLYGI